MNVAVCTRPYKGRKVYAHRFSYEHFVGPIPTGLVINHKCRNKLCVNPDHLEATTQADNIRHAVSGKKPTPVCKRGHLRTSANTYTFPNGTRACRPCQDLAIDKYNSRKDLRRRWPLGPIEVV